MNQKTSFFFTSVNNIILILLGYKRIKPRKESKQIFILYYSLACIFVWYLYYNRGFVVCKSLLSMFSCLCLVSHVQFSCFLNVLIFLYLYLSDSISFFLYLFPFATCSASDLLIFQMTSFINKISYQTERDKCLLVHTPLFLLCVSLHARASIPPMQCWLVVRLLSFGHVPNKTSTINIVCNGLTACWQNAVSGLLLKCVSVLLSMCTCICTFMNVDCVFFVCQPNC